MAKAARQWLIDRLLEQGIDQRIQLVVMAAGPRSKLHTSRRWSGCIGYYSGLSQYRWRLHMTVSVPNIESGLSAIGSDVTGTTILRELQKTVAHEMGHAIAEAVREDGRLCGRAIDAPVWTGRFVDEEDFAEDFARFLQSEVSDRDFWHEFLPAFVRDYKANRELLCAA